LREEERAIATLIKRADGDRADLMDALDKALSRFSNLQDDYVNGSESHRKMLNRWFFDRIEVGPEGMGGDTIDAVVMSPVPDALRAWLPTANGSARTAPVNRLSSGQEFGRVLQASTFVVFRFTTVRATMTFVDRITASQTRWDAAVVLLETWNARPDGVVPIRDRDEFLWLVDEVREHFEARPQELELDDADRAEILRWTEAGADPHRVDAVGFGLNLSSSLGFAQCWRERLGGEPYRPAIGDVYPCAAAPWPPSMDGGRRTPSPFSMNVDDGDHPYVRVFRAGLLTVEFAFDLWRPLSRIAAGLDRIAAITVNEDLGELGLDRPRAVAFPVTPVDPEEQERRVLGQLERAIEAGARIVVLPELATTRAIVERVVERLAEDEGQRLVVCGSWHETVDGAPANVSLGLISGLRARMRHRKLVEFGDLFPAGPDRRRREGIVASEAPVLRVHVAGAFRFALLICKDFLDERVTRTLDRVGANVLLVPALSRTTQPFVARAHGHVADAQALTVVANGPRGWVDPAAALVRPYEPRDVATGHPATAPSPVVFSLRQGRTV